MERVLQLLVLCRISAGGIPLCYSAAHAAVSQDARRRKLAGTWVQDEGSPSYWNLSCPFEFSKYACARHTPRGERGVLAHKRFEPTGCRFVNLDDGGAHIARILGNRTVLMHGDSLIRQLYQAMGCLVMPAALSVRWAPKWPCQGEPNCVPGHKHSFFERSSFRLGGLVAPPALTDADEKHADAAYGLKVHVGRRGPMLGLTRRDVVVVGAGIHYPAAHATRTVENWLAPYLARSAAARPRIIVFVSPPPAFPSERGDGEYDGVFLARLQAESPESVHCSDKVRPVRSDDEFRWLQRPGLYRSLEGVIALEGIETQGNAKVGGRMGMGGLGKFGDCQHYCMPGVPDALARALYTLLTTLDDVQPPVR